MAIDYTQLGSGQQYLPLIASAARTTSPNQQQVSALSCDVDSLVVILNMTGVTATGAVAVTIEGVDPQTNVTYPILTVGSLTTVGVTVLRVNPSLTAGAGIAKDVVPPVTRFTAAVTGGVSMTFSLTALFMD